MVLQEGPIQTMYENYATVFDGYYAVSDDCKLFVAFERFYDPTNCSSEQHDEMKIAHFKKNRDITVELEGGGDRLVISSYDNTLISIGSCNKVVTNLEKYIDGNCQDSEEDTVDANPEDEKLNAELKIFPIDDSIVTAYFFRNGNYITFSEENKIAIRKNEDNAFIYLFSLMR